MQIKKAEFVISNSDLSRCPSDGRVEFAFIGRSNVGKSSLINMITQQKGLAKTSQKPGKTQLINHFLVNDSFYIVDLPGYGYAKTYQEKKAELRSIIYTYIYQREALTSLFVLIDIRHAPLAIDLDFLRGLGEHGVPFAIVFTKSDKLSNAAIHRNVEAYKKRLLEEWEELPPIFVTSSERRQGRDELLEYIEQIQLSLQ